MSTPPITPPNHQLPPVSTAQPASSLRHASRPAYALPPTPAELLWPCPVRGSVDTVRLNLHRANPRSASLVAISRTGFAPIPCKRKDGEEAPEFVRAIWHHASGATITHTRNGTSVTITPARLAYGRNDRLSDVRHAGIPHVLSWLTDDLLGATTEAERLRAVESDLPGAHLIGMWRATTLHLASHLWVQDEAEVDTLLRVFALAVLGRQRQPPRIWWHRDAAGRARVHSIQFGVGKTKGRKPARRSAITVCIYDKGVEEQYHDSAIRMLQRCGGEALPRGRVLRFEVQFNTAAAIASMPLLLGSALALDDPAGEPALPRVDDDGQLASVLIGEERCHAVILAALREILGFAAPWPLAARRRSASWCALRMRAERFAKRWMSDDPPERCGAGAAMRSLSMRLLLRKMAPGVVQRIWPRTKGEADTMPVFGHHLPKRVAAARRMARNRAA